MKRQLNKFHNKLKCSESNAISLTAGRYFKENRGQDQLQNNIFRVGRFLSQGSFSRKMLPSTGPTFLIVLTGQSIT